jgi:hypothetical protein
MNLRALSESNLRNAGINWFAAGVVLLAIAAGFGIRTSVFLLRSVSARGRIVHSTPVETHGRPYDSQDHAPAFTFTAEDGKSYTGSSDISTSPPEFAIGDEVKVYYEKGHPEGAKLASFPQLWFYSFVLGILGAFFTCAGYILLLFDRRRARRRMLSSSPSAAGSGD